MRLPWASSPLRAAMGLGALALWTWLAQAPKAPAQEPLALVLKEEETGKTLWCASVRPQEEFVLEFLHSYDRFLVRENYKVLGPGKILFQGLVTRSMLNGQGFVAARAHTRPDGWLETVGGQAPRDGIEFIMGHRQHADHRILLHAQEHHLSEFIRPGTFVLGQIEPGECSGQNLER